jgi:hypothetical protein
MRYLDYTWDLEPEGIILDEELNLERLGWEDGDIFRFVNVNGKYGLRKIDPIEKFARGFSNVTENQQGKLQ